MIKTNIFRYYAFGFNWAQLRRLGPGAPVRSGKWSVVRRLRDYFDFLDELRLAVTSQASGALRTILSETEQMPEDALLDDVVANRLRTALDRVDVTLDAELQLAQAFLIQPARFSPSQLLETPESLLRAKVFHALPALCRFDFSEACLCIAFARPTAAAFHLMRCVEGYLRAYYCALVKRDRVAKLMWFEMLDHLAKRRRSPPKALLNHLDNLRSNFRNPTQHPEARYDLDEAQDLLAVTIDAINRMATDLGV